jgi:hypothetical protein
MGEATREHTALRINNTKSIIFAAVLSMSCGIARGWLLMCIRISLAHIARHALWDDLPRMYKLLLHGCPFIHVRARARGVFIVLIKHSRKLVCLRRERTFTEKRIGAYICVTLQTKSRASQELIYISALLYAYCVNRCHQGITVCDWDAIGLGNLDDWLLSFCSYCSWYSMKCARITTKMSNDTHLK